MTQSGHSAKPVGVSKADGRVLLQVRELRVRADRNYRPEVDQLIDCQSMESDTKTRKQLVREIERKERRMAHGQPLVGTPKSRESSSQLTASRKTFKLAGNHFCRNLVAIGLAGSISAGIDPFIPQV